jgi:UDP-N-acetylglucosamine:LPS N-acetylglucosamine transferase
MLDIAAQLPETQLILICGKNQSLAQKLRAKDRRAHHIEGFTTEIPYFMQLADFFIGKPGPGSISEALQFHLPVIVECNSKTLPQERYNAQWIAEKRFGIVVRSFREIAPAVRRLLQSPTFEELRFNVSAYSNRALFEVPIILEKCYEDSQPPKFPRSNADSASAKLTPATQHS